MKLVPGVVLGVVLSGVLIQNSAQALDGEPCRRKHQRVAVLRLAIGGTRQSSKDSRLRQAESTIRWACSTASLSTEWYTVLYNELASIITAPHIFHHTCSFFISSTDNVEPRLEVGDMLFRLAVLSAHDDALKMLISAGYIAQQCSTIPEKSPSSGVDLLRWVVRHKSTVGQNVLKAIRKQGYSVDDIRAVEAGMRSRDEGREGHAFIVQRERELRRKKRCTIS